MTARFGMVIVVMLPDTDPEYIFNAQLNPAHLLHFENILGEYLIFLFPVVLPLRINHDFFYLRFV
jgi:hypothetical protein